MDKPTVLTAETKLRIAKHFEQFFTDERLERMREVLSNRTRFVSVILEDIYQPHNASAVLRSCDCYGIQDVYTVEDKHAFEISTGVTRKAHQWLTLHKFGSQNGGIISCLNEVKRRGYKIAVMSPDAEMTVEDVPLDGPIAFLFGTEKEGVSKDALSQADYKVKVPMYGFSESLNVSVSVAITLYQTIVRLRKIKAAPDLGLSYPEKEELWYAWLKKAVKRSELIEDDFLKKSDH